MAGSRQVLGAAIFALRQGKMSRADLCEVTGIHPSQLSQMESGSKPWAPKHLDAIAAALGMTRAEFDAKVKEIIASEPLEYVQRLRRGELVAPSPHRAAPGRGIPIINTTNGGPPSEAADPGVDNHAHLPITPEMVGDPDAFAVTLLGDSMESEFHEGDILVFAPSAEVEDGDACFVGFRTGEHTFKCVYDLGGGRLELRPLNTRKHRTQIVSTESDTGVVRVVKLVGRYQIWNWKRRA